MATTISKTPTLVQIRPGDETPPIIIVHGLSGTIQVSDLAAHIDTHRPIYAVQARGLDGLEEPLDRVEEMAELYVGALNERFPRNRCILIGYSFGGLVAVEMAQRLLEVGRPPAMLILIDAYPCPRYMPAKWRALLFLRKIQRHLRRARRLPLRYAIPYLLRLLQHKVHLAEAPEKIPEIVEEPTLKFSKEARARVRQSIDLSYLRYRPRYYSGKIYFVTTPLRVFFPADPAHLWRPLSKEFQIETVPGNHITILSKHLDPLASLLTRYLQQVHCEHEGAPVVL